MEYRNVSDHPEELAGGRTLEPGEFVDLSDEEAKDPYNAALISDGTLVSTASVEGVEATDAAISLAKKQKVSLASVKGTGDGGRVTVADVETYIEAQKGGTGQ